MERISDVVFRTAFRILCDRVDSEEVTNKVMLYADRHEIIYDGSEGSMDWFLRQTCLRSRLIIARRRLLWLLNVRNELFVRASPKAENQDDYVTKQAWQVYCRAVFRMTPLQGMAYTLCVLEELPLGRVAGILELSEFRIGIALERASAKIRRELAVYGRSDLYCSFVKFIRMVNA